MDEWVTLLFTERLIPVHILTSYSRLNFMWRELGTHFLPSNVREIDHYNSRDLMVWAGISVNFYIHPYVFAKGTVTAVRYMDEDLEPMFASSRVQLTPILFKWMTMRGPIELI
ncbi:uncharacterized protein TNCV_4873851 [Trichonephila clavipes]|nr:uncharacterized protein TNCV_4873851 [Trichonephila clavipes]